MAPEELTFGRWFTLTLCKRSLLGRIPDNEKLSRRQAVKIPLASLSADALRSIIETFVLREGTDYGHADHGLEAKCAAVLRQLEAGEAEIDFDPETGSVDVRPIEQRK
jgi:uncharacterized protein YheU (UPF0270 family)